MSLFITSLNSGSNGNCYYVGNHTEAILIDAGISCKEVEKRMKRLNLSLEKVKAIFISHEHSDHIRGIEALVKKYKFPVYTTDVTLVQGRLRIEDRCVSFFKPHEPVYLGGLSITPFPKFHDACDPFSFLVEHNEIKVGVFTDIGRPCEQLIRYFKQCHAAFLEANYDEHMLETGNYPYHLKRRIKGGHGHLSNRQALELFTTHRPAFMTHLFLSHLSKNNNCPQLVAELFNRNASGVKMVIASRDGETALHEIAHGGIQADPIRKQLLKPSQLAFAFG